MKCALATRNAQEIARIKRFTTQAVRRSAAHWFNFKNFFKNMRYSNVTVVYIWFKYKDYMLYGRLKLYHVLLNYKTD